MNAQPPTILVMDDEIDIRHIFREHLQRNNRLKVRLAPTVNSAQALLFKERFLGGVFDLRMNGGDPAGLRVVEAFRNLDSFAYIEVVTAFPEYEELAKSSGADNVLIKPLDFDVLVDRITHGIAVKQIDRLSELVGTSLESKILFETTPDTRQNFNNRLFQIDVIADNLSVIREFLEEGRGGQKLDSRTSTVLYKGIAQKLAELALDNGELVHQNKPDNRGRDILMIEMLTRALSSEPFSADRNLATLAQRLDELLRDHPGEYVAIVEGQIVDFDRDDKKLFLRLSTNYPEKGGLIQRLNDSTSATKHIRGPRSNKY